MFRRAFVAHMQFSLANLWQILDSRNLVVCLEIGHPYFSEVCAFSSMTLYIYISDIFPKLLVQYVIGKSVIHTRSA